MSALALRADCAPSSPATFGWPLRLGVGTVTRSEEPLYLVGDALNEHWHVVGKSKSGKSNLLTMLAIQIAGSDEGGLLFDPHGGQGGFSDKLIELIARYRLYHKKKIIILDPSSGEWAPSIDILRVPPGATVRAVVDLAVNAVLRGWGQEETTSTPRIRTVLTHLFTALIELKLTILEAGIFLWDEHGPSVRDALVAQIPSVATRVFWEGVFRRPSSSRVDYLESASSRLQPFVANPYIKRLFGQPERALDLAKEMDEGTLIILRLPWDGIRLSPEDTRLIGAVLINQLLTACFQRKNPKRRFWTIIDECGEFLTRDIALALDQTRKRGLRLILSHQHLGQLRKAGEEVESAVLNDTGIRAVFRGLVPDDTRIFAEIMYRGFYDLQKLKTKLTRMQATGNTKERMLGGAESQNASRTVGENWSESEQSAENHSTTTSAGTARSVADSTSKSMTLSSGETTAQSESDTEQRDPSGEAKEVGTAHTDGTSTATSESAAYTAGNSRSITNSANAAVAETDGTSTGRSSQRGGSVADAVGSATTASWSEAYRTEYQELPTGDTWSLEEQIHLRSVSLARVPVGYCHIQVQTAHPQRVYPAYLGDVPVLPSLTARVTEKLMAEASPNGAAEEVDQEIAERQKALAQLAPPPMRRPARTKAPRASSAAPFPAQPDPELDDDPNDEAGWEALRRRTEGGADGG